MNVGDIIVKLRKERGMTQAQLGKEMMISSQAVSKWESGNSSPDFDTIIRLSNFFNVPITHFVPKSNTENIESKDDTAVKSNCQIDINYIDIEKALLDKKPHLIINVLFSLFWTILFSILFFLTMEVEVNIGLNIFFTIISSYMFYSTVFCLSYNSNVMILKNKIMEYYLDKTSSIGCLIVILFPVTLSIRVLILLFIMIVSSVFFPKNIINYKKEGLL